MLLVEAVISAVINLVIFVAIPFVPYAVFQMWRRKRSFKEVMQRTGLQGCEMRYLGYSLVAASLVVAGLVLSPSIESLTHERSPQEPFIGLGLSGTSIAMALLYGVVKTGFAEEFLFRGMIAGSLSRRLPLAWANVWQAVIFLAPHLLLLLVVPEMWAVMPVIFAGALFVGWIRIRSGSILGPWLVHAVANVATCLSVAIRTQG